MQLEDNFFKHLEKLIEWNNLTVVLLSGKYVRDLTMFTRNRLFTEISNQKTFFLILYEYVNSRTQLKYVISDGQCTVEQE